MKRIILPAIEIEKKKKDLTPITSCGGVCLFTMGHLLRYRKYTLQVQSMKMEGWNASSPSFSTYWAYGKKLRQHFNTRVCISCGKKAKYICLPSTQKDNADSLLYLSYTQFFCGETCFTYAMLERAMEKGLF